LKKAQGHLYFYLYRWSWLHCFRVAVHDVHISDTGLLNGAERANNVQVSQHRSSSSMSRLSLLGLSEFCRGL